MSSHLRVWVASPLRTLFLRVHDLSCGGVGLRAPTGFQRGDRVQVTLPDDVHRSATVAWAEENAIGLRFETD